MRLRRYGSSRSCSAPGVRLQNIESEQYRPVLSVQEYEIRTTKASSVRVAAMASTNPVDLDEIVHRRPDVLDWWVNSMGGQPMDENMIHRYFCESPFFDWSTKNGLVFTQGARDEHTWQMTHNRKALEDNLRKRQGVEYMIAGEPQPVADKTKAAQGGNTGIYVIRKQDRQRARDNLSARQPGVTSEDGWELTSLGTYYTVGENVFQAPSVKDVIGNRLLSAASSLSQFFDIASDLPSYNPTTGYTYLSNPSKQISSDSAHVSPTHSREGSVAPGAEPHSQRSNSVQAESQIRTGASTANVQDTRLLVESLRMAISYGDEYVDENPLIGEPGHLSFTSSVAAVKRRKAEEEAAAAKARAERESNSNSRPASPKAQKAPSPPPVFTDTKVAAKTEKSGKEDRRGSKVGEKLKRRKSKMVGTAQSPTTPSSALSTQAPNSSF